MVVNDGLEPAPGWAGLSLSFARGIRVLAQRRGVVGIDCNRLLLGRYPHALRHHRLLVFNVSEDLLLAGHDVFKGISLVHIEG